MFLTRLGAVVLAIATLGSSAYADIVDDAAKLAAGGVSEEVMLAWANDQGNFALTGQDVIALKDAKVPDAVIVALLRRADEVSIAEKPNAGPTRLTSLNGLPILPPAKDLYDGSKVTTALGNPDDTPELTEVRHRYRRYYSYPRYRYHRYPYYSSYYPRYYSSYYYPSYYDRYYYRPYRHYRPGNYLSFGFGF
jgi:hypothetical protein